MSFIAELVEPFIQQRLVDPESVLGCSDAELTVLMNAQHVSALPQSYREFMGYGGKNPYWLSRDAEWDYDWLLQAKDMAREIVTEHEEDFTPFEKAFVFQTHQGYMFYYFRAEDLSERDPHFWIYTANEPLRVSEHSFAEWLGEVVNYLPELARLREKFGIQ